MSYYVSCETIINHFLGRKTGVSSRSVRGTGRDVRNPRVFRWSIETSDHPFVVKA